MLGLGHNLLRFHFDKHPYLGICQLLGRVHERAKIRLQWKLGSRDMDLWDLALPELDGIVSGEYES